MSFVLKSLTCRVVLAICVMTVAWLTSCRTSAAQQMPYPCLKTFWGVCFYGEDCSPTEPGEFIIGPGPGGFTLLYGILLPPCVPPKCNCGSATAGGPIYLGNGDTYVAQTDISLPGLGGGLRLDRTWHSLWPTTEIASSVGIFGPNWKSTYEERLYMSTDNSLTYLRGDGIYWSFGLNNYGVLVVAAPANITATAFAGTASSGSRIWIVRFQSGEQRVFDPVTGHLLQIIDRNGNTTQLAYDGSG